MSFEDIPARAGLELWFKNKHILGTIKRKLVLRVDDMNAYLSLINPAFRTQQRNT
jgi:hypothetical protein